MSTAPKMSKKGKDMTTSTPFGALKQVEAGVLSVGYAEAGPADGPAVMLLHGWPYDIHSFAEVTPLLGRLAAELALKLQETPDLPCPRGWGPALVAASWTVAIGAE